MRAQVEARRGARTAHGSGAVHAALLFAERQFHIKRAIGATADMNLPGTLATVPREGAQNYTIGFVAGTRADSSFSLEAVPTGSMQGDRCGTLQLDNKGVRGIVNAKTGLVPSDCWR
ncbi:type IV pilin protein [Variovorax sp. WS11]|uniref:type IV pilin protein n=2 Tax=Variovorax sp. WS11 TaxID=1105204 RepID=UPI0023B229F9|nr:type IV pilin protein [Variovorax sp. WS11]